MTRARRKGSLSQSRGKGRDHVEGWSHGAPVGGARPAHSLQAGKVEKDTAKKAKHGTQKHMETRPQYDGKCHQLPKHSMKMKESKKAAGKRGKTTSERNRKLYPLRGRAGASDSEALSCHVLLTRLDERAEETKLCEVGPNRVSGHKKTPKSFKTEAENREWPKTVNKPSAQEPRKRRLASLNAEAVNSLLLEKSDGPPGAKLAKKQGDGASTTERAKSFSNPRRASKTETCQNPKQVKKAKSDKPDVDEASLYAPTPRRLAGLNAAALLKLTSLTAANKQRIKADHKTVCASGKPGKPKAQNTKKHSWKQPDLEGVCDVCNSRSFESKLTFEGSPEHRRLTKPGFQSRSMLGYPMKVVKEEQVEAELSPYYCCPPEGSVEYCHRLALFLGQKAYVESEEHPVASVKHECLVPAHPALTLSAHPCLCADPCYSGYYVHIAHPRPPAASLSAQPLPCTHSPFCPRGVSRSKLLSSSVSHASGIPHPACCGPVGTTCCREACRVGRYAFQPVTSRTCSFSSNCSNCSKPIKTEGFSSAPDEHGLLVPPVLPLSGCPSMPQVNPSSPVVPRLLSAMSDRRQAEVRLKVGKECPQNTKPSNGSLTMGHSRLSQKRTAAGPASAKHQKRANRRQATNGWRPVGAPAEKEVFIAGDDETVLRQCYEGVERDGEVIRVRDTVLLRSGPRKKTLPYVAKISALWEDPRTGELMMSLFWYYRPEHTQGGRDPSMHCENEIFASRHQDENSVACIEDRCYVLPLAQYCRFCALVKRRLEGVSDRTPVVPAPSDSAVPSHRLVPAGIDPQLVYLCRHVYDFRYGRILKNLQ